MTRTWNGEEWNLKMNTCQVKHNVKNAAVYAYALIKAPYLILTSTCSSPALL